MKEICSILTVLIIAFQSPSFAETPATYESWIKSMKADPRGPFSRIRWFCNDGSILAPEPYACREKGGGVQHGEWTSRVKTMRENGYYIANVFADLSPDPFLASPDHIWILKQMMLEQFLIRADNGWIFRKARFYRGALQAEGEAFKGGLLLQGLLKTYQQSPEKFLLLREAARLLPHHLKNAPVSEMRQLALAIAESDDNFLQIRTKIHVRPEAEDAQSVREYARRSGTAELKDQYDLLARKIEEVFRPADLSPYLNTLSKQVKPVADARRIKELAAGLAGLERDRPLTDQLQTAAQLSVLLRHSFSGVKSPEVMLSVLDTSLLLENEAFRLASGISETLAEMSVENLLRVLEDCTDIAYGTGLFSLRQHRAMKKRLADMVSKDHTLDQFRSGLIYLARASEWSEKNMLFHFSRAMDHFQRIEPVSERYVHDRLHSSILLIYSSILERLTTDNSQQIGLTNTIWNEPVAVGVNALNPGLAKGVLRIPGPGQNLDDLPGDSIVVLPATTSHLPSVAGIITAGQGNILSHIQLLARNLGVPNIAVDKNLLPRIRKRAGEKIVLAVSPRGIVNIESFKASWNQVFIEKKQVLRSILKADTDKLDLSATRLVELGTIRAKDSGRIAGPKAANLGELKHFFPEAVTEGVVIPFGLFKRFLDQPMNNPAFSEDTGLSMFDWMRQQYRIIEDLNHDPVRQQDQIKTTLERIRSWILATDPAESFRRALKQKLDDHLGPDNSFGVFVRSDTNVEDLPGFTGAGLNLTVPHVVGFDNIFTAVKQVWASPFTLRSFGWRHAYLENPEHVYVSVLLMKTVPVEKSGVMVTRNLATGRDGWLTIAVNEGVGGAVSGQNAEEIRVDLATVQVTLLSQAAEPLKRIVLPSGGMGKTDASGTEAVLSKDEISQLIRLARQLPDRFPIFQNNKAQVPAADVEFGFLKSRLVLFQIRPLAEDAGTLQNKYLTGMDRQMDDRRRLPMDLNRIPLQEE